MKNQRQFIITATLLALFSSPLLYAFEDCGTSVTECKLWQAIQALQEQNQKLVRQLEQMKKRVVELETYRIPEAQRTADTAISKADSAQRTANDAIGKANRAQQTADANKLKCVDGSTVTGGPNKWSPSSICPAGYIAVGLARIDLHGDPNAANNQVNDFTCDNNGCNAWCAGYTCTVISRCCR